MGTLKSAIEIRDLNFGYRGHSVLKDVNLSFPKNEFSVILGQNGSGKSTLLRIIAGLLPYCNGDININNIPFSDLKNKEKACQIGFLAQNHKPVFPFTVKDVVLTGRAAYINYLPKRKDRDIAHAALEKTDILHLKNRMYTELSGGEQQLVMIARLLAQQPRILLLDEPISHLDYNNQIKIIKLIKELVKEELTIITVLHDPNIAFLFGDRFFFVHDKKVHSENSTEPWKTPLVRKIFHENIIPVSHGEKVIFIPSIQ